MAVGPARTERRRRLRWWRVKQDTGSRSHRQYRHNECQRQPWVNDRPSQFAQKWGAAHTARKIKLLMFVDIRHRNSGPYPESISGCKQYPEPPVMAPHIRSVLHLPASVQEYDSRKAGQGKRAFQGPSRITISWCGFTRKLLARPEVYLHGNGPRNRKPRRLMIRSILPVYGTTMVAPTRFAKT